MAFECMYGRVSTNFLILNLINNVQRPYIGKTRKEIRDHIL
jgi:hypothetical protein